MMETVILTEFRNAPEIIEVLIPILKKGEVLIKIHALQSTHMIQLLWKVNMELKHKVYLMVLVLKGSDTVIQSGGGLIGKYFIGKRVLLEKINPEHGHFIRKNVNKIYERE